MKGCPFSKDPQHKITLPILGQHLVALNLFFLIAKLYNAYLLSWLSYLLSISLLICLISIQIKKFLGLELNKEQASCGGCSFDLNDQATIKSLYVNTFTIVNNSIQYFRKVVLLKDYFFTLKFIGGLYFLSKLALFLGDFGLIYLACNAACVVPFVLQNYGSQINEKTTQAKQNFQEKVKKALQKIPTNKKAQ